MTKFFYLIVNLFNKFYLLQMKICCERSKKIEIEDGIPDVEDEETVLDFWGSSKSTDIWRKYENLVKNSISYFVQVTLLYKDFSRVVVDLVEEFARLGKAPKWNIYYFIVFFAQALTLGVSLILIKYYKLMNKSSICCGISSMNLKIYKMWVCKIIKNHQASMTSLYEDIFQLEYFGVLYPDWNFIEGPQAN